MTALDAGVIDDAEVLHAAKKRRAQRAGSHRKFAQSCGNQARMKAALSQAAVMESIEVQPEDLDAVSRVLTLENGRFDLEALPGGGEVDVDPTEFAAALSDHSRLDRSTHIAPTAFDGSAECPKFMAFLEMIQPAAETRAYLQRVFGYTLSGSMAEQCAFLFRGEGANGKSTLLSTIGGVLGDYKVGCPIETFLRDRGRSGSGPSPDLARLPGARMIVASEPETGAVLSEARIKAFTGGEEITARNLNEGFFDYLPQGKLFLSFNRTPQIKADDDGTWRRLHIVPFPFTIPKGSRRKLEVVLAEFKTEAPGILNWMLEGWRAYAADAGGLGMPPEVEVASRELRESFDNLGQCIADLCVRDEREVLLFKAFRQVAGKWFDSQGITGPTPNSLGRRLSERGFKRTEVGKKSDRAYRGLRFKGPEENRPDEMQSWLHEFDLPDVGGEF